jgi:alkylation response protein AidB-like acyl-CoA dehydrogenase
MSLSLAELRDSARQTFGAGGLVPDAQASWATLTEMGWFAMTVPEEQGGLGLGQSAVAAIHYELGRALVPGPAIGQMAAIEVLAATGQNELLEAAMAGQKIALDVLNFIDADRASHNIFLWPDQVRVGPAKVATHQESWDETRRLFSVGADEGGEPVLEGRQARAVHDRAMATALLALAADSLGGADAALTMTIDYLKTRRQFDRPLAIFQALKHRVADLKIALAGAEALLWSRASGEPTLAQMGALKAHCCAVYKMISEEAIQLHGGIGLTQEHPCHLFLKRAFLNCALGGDADHWEEFAGRELIGSLEKIS